ncbi:MAG: OB-fold nucleic acid binding domain-containing protein [archaeon]
MINIPLEDMISKMVKESGLSEADIKKKISQKMDQLSGLISKEGAAHIIANELGVKLVKVGGRLKVKDILAGMRDIETVGRVAQVFDMREFSSANRSGKVGSFVMGDDTGTVRIVLWNDQADQLANIKEGSVVRIKDAYVKDNQGRVEVHLNFRSSIVLNPEGESVAEIRKAESRRKQIKDLKENDDSVEILGTIVQTFDPRFFEVCPSCNKRVRQSNGSFRCDEHGEITPGYSYVLNLFLDDGTENIRCVFFRKQAEDLLKKSPEEIIRFKDAPETFEEMKTELLGNFIKVAGRVTKNQMFDRLELISNSVVTDLNPEDEVKRLEAEKQTQSSTPKATAGPSPEKLS